MPQYSSHAYPNNETRSYRKASYLSSTNPSSSRTATNNYGYNSTTSATTSSRFGSPFTGSGIPKVNSAKMKSVVDRLHGGTSRPRRNEDDYSDLLDEYSSGSSSAKGLTKKYSSSNVMSRTGNRIMSNASSSSVETATRRLSNTLPSLNSSSLANPRRSSSEYEKSQTMGPSKRSSGSSSITKNGKPYDLSSLARRPSGKSGSRKSSKGESSSRLGSRDSDRSKHDRPSPSPRTPSRTSRSGSSFSHRSSRAASKVGYTSHHTRNLSGDSSSSDQIKSRKQRSESREKKREEKELSKDYHRSTSTSYSKLYHSSSMDLDEDNELLETKRREAKEKTRLLKLKKRRTSRLTDNEYGDRPEKRVDYNTSHTMIGGGHDAYDAVAYTTAAPHSVSFDSEEADLSDTICSTSRRQVQSRMSSASSRRTLNQSMSTCSLAEPCEFEMPSVTSGGRIRGVVGLRNLGNTCFMNSCLQCLCSAPPVIHYFSKGLHLKDINTKSRTKGSLARAFGELVLDIRRGQTNDVLIPSDVKRTVAMIAPRFSGYGQQDIQEFLQFLLDGLHDDLNLVKVKPAYEEIKDRETDTDELKSNRWWRNYLDRNQSFISDLFCGQLSSAVVCQSCGHKSQAFDPFWSLSVPIPSSGSSRMFGSSKASLYQCFDEFTKEELLTGHDQFYCSKCKTHRDVVKNMKIFRFPHILVVHLKRFSSSMSHSSFSRQKLTTTIDFPINGLDLGKFAPKRNSAVPAVYNLFAVSNHTGSLGGGHYTAYGKVGGDMWYNFNDSHCSRTSTSNIVSNQAYVLFYMRQ